MLSGIAVSAASGAQKKNFKAITYTARGIPLSVRGVGFKPDVIITKDRVNAGNTVCIFGTALNALTPLPYEVNSTIRWENSIDPPVVDGNPNGTLLSLDADGFSIGANDKVCKTAVPSDNFAAWCFKRDSKFMNIVNWSGTAGNRAIAHGLSSTPKMIIVFQDGATDASYVYHSNNTAAPETDYLRFNKTDATVDDIVVWNDTLPDATNFTVGSSLNALATNYYALVFCETAGLAKFGGYTGNGSATGAIIDTVNTYISMLLIKRTDVAADWVIYDKNRRNGGGTEYYRMSLNTTGVEAAGEDVDLNGSTFQPQTTNARVNAAGGTYIYAAFA